jgi:hypothetical protein
MAEEDLPVGDIEEEVVDKEESTEVEDDYSDIPEQWRNLDKRGMSKVFRDKDSHIGKLQEEKRRAEAEASRLAGRLEALEGQVQTMSSRQPETKEEVFEFDYDKPGESIDKLVDRKIAQREKHSIAQQQKTLYDRCSRAHQDGLSAAIARNPKLFEGIEAEVGNDVFAAFNPYVMSGNDLSDELRKPETWTKVARYKRLERNELDYLKSNTIEPVSSDLTERPQSGSSAGAKRSPKSLLNPVVEKMMRDMGIDEKTALAFAKEVQEEQKGKT